MSSLERRKAYMNNLRNKSGSTKRKTVPKKAYNVSSRLYQSTQRGASIGNRPSRYRSGSYGKNNSSTRKSLNTSTDKKSPRRSYNVSSRLYPGPKGSGSRKREGSETRPKKSYNVSSRLYPGPRNRVSEERRKASEDRRNRLASEERKRKAV